MRMIRCLVAATTSQTTVAQLSVGANKARPAANGVRSGVATAVKVWASLRPLLEDKTGEFLNMTVSNLLIV